MNTSPSSQEVLRVLLPDIEDNPYQARTVYDDSMVTALAASILDVGLLQTPLARRVGDKFQMAFGHRRKRAFERLLQNGITAYESMPLIIAELTDLEMFEISISENIKREDLSPIERAAALRRYMDEFGATSKQAARLFGIPEGTVRGTVRLLNLPEDAQQQMKDGRMSQSQARRILRKPETQQKRLEPTAHEGPFDLRKQLMILVYERVRSDVDDPLLFKKIREIVELNKQLERQIEAMNGRRRERAKIGPSRRLQPA